MPNYVIDPLTGRLVDASTMGYPGLPTSGGAQVMPLLQPGAVPSPTPAMNNPTPPPPMNTPTPSGVPGLGNPGPIGPPQQTPSALPPAPQRAPSGWSPPGPMVTTDPDGTRTIHVGAALNHFGDWVNRMVGDVPPTASPAPQASGGTQPPAAPPVQPPAPVARPPVAAPPAAPVAAPTAPASPINEALQNGARQGALDPNAPYVPSPAMHDAYRSVIFGPESGGNQNAHNPYPGMTASGLGQFTDGTFQRFVGSPENLAQGQFKMSDKNNPTAQAAATDWLADRNASQMTQALGRPPTVGEVASAHFLGAAGTLALMKNPNGDAYSILKSVEPGQVDAAFRSNPGLLVKGNTAAQTLQLAQGHFFGRGAGTQVAAASPQTATDATTDGGLGTGAAPRDGGVGANATGTQIRGVGGSTDAVANFLNRIPLQPDWGQKLQALAGGFGGARSFGEGVGAAARNMQGLDENYRQTALQAGSTAASLESMGLRYGVQEKRYELAQKAQDFKQQGGDLGNKDNAREYEEMMQSAEHADSQLLPAIGDLRKVLATSGAGPDVVSRFKRYVANEFNLDLGANPDSMQLASTLGAQLRSGQIRSQMGGLGLRNMREFNSFVEGMAGLDKRPDTMGVLLDRWEHVAQVERKMRDDFLALPTQQRQTLRGTPYAMSEWQAPYYKALGQMQGASGTPGVPSQGTLQQSPDGSWKSNTGYGFQLK